jgi:hypothetical protein
VTTRLFIYNEALGHLGERQLASLTEQREPRRVLDSYWDDTVAYCLRAALWRFGLRTVQEDASTSIVPQFGYNYAFIVPTDWVRTYVVSTAPNMDPPLLQYWMEAGFIYANITPVYIKFVSNDPTYGMNIGGWPEEFVDYLSLRLARYSCLRITNDKELRKELKDDENKARRVAKAEQAMDEPPGLPPVSFWVRARRGGFGPGGLFLGGGTGGGGPTGPGSNVTGPSGDD